MIFRWLVAFYILVGGPLFADLLMYGNEPQIEEKRITVGIQGIFLTAKSEDILPEGRPLMTGIQAMDIEIPGGLSSLSPILRPYLGKLVTQKNVIEIKQKIMTYYVSKGVSTLEVEVPPQKTAGGVVQFLISVKQLGKAIYKGETWYSNDQLNRYLGVYPGNEISEENLQNNLSWLNQNPFQNTTMKYVPGDQPDVLDIEFTSRKRRVIRLYERADDTGSANTGYGRFASGFVWGNALWIGDLFSFEYQFSNEFKRYQTFTGSYTAFLSWKHILTTLATGAIIKPSTVNAHCTAKSFQFSPRYIIPFKPFYTPFQQSLQIGFDYKYTNSSIANLTSGSASVQPAALPATLAQINVTQVVGDYTLFDTFNFWGCTSDFSLDVAFYASPFQFLAHQNKKSYEHQRLHSKPKYCYANVTCGNIITIPKIMAISVLLRGQIASRTLPSTELMSMGGFDTVRGYHEAEVAGDNGFIANLELRSPPLTLFKKVHDQLIFLAFLDYGLSNNWYIPPLIGTRRYPRSQYPDTQYLLGVGPGLRYTINPYLQVRCDYGFKLHQLFISTQQDHPLLLGFGQFHIGALVSY